MTIAMDRRAFIRGIACLAAGTAALPEQIDAFERYYEVNTPPGTPLAGLDEVCIGGIASKSMPVAFEICRGDQRLLHFGINLFGGMLRWAALPDQKIIITKPNLRWRITAPEAFSITDLTGQCSYIDASFVRRYVAIDRLEGWVVDQMRDQTLG